MVKLPLVSNIIRVVERRIQSRQSIVRLVRFFSEPMGTVPKSSSQHESIFNIETNIESGKSLNVILMLVDIIPVHHGVRAHPVLRPASGKDIIGLICHIVDKAFCLSFYLKGVGPLSSDHANSYS